MKKISLFLLPLFLLFACGKGPETITVQSNPSDLFSTPDSTISPGDTTGEDDFIHITIGEIAEIESLDPLFASSNSEYRVINLIYEKLVDLNDFGNPAPALAKRWEVNRDSTQFVFHLKTSVFFHDSPVFESGTGRHFTAQDVKYAFERMAFNDVPDFTARHFTDIRGFSAYHNELTYVKNPAKRAIKSIDGIRVRDDSTVVFLMKQSAPDFLHRLSHPMASIYPHESVPEGYKPIQQASGTGLFSFIKKEDQALLLTINNDYAGFTPDINRLDIISGLPEKDLYQDFARGNLDALIELGGSTLQSISDSTGQLLQMFEPNYTLEKAEPVSKYSIYFNNKSGQARQVNEFISSLEEQNFFKQSYLGSVTFNTLAEHSALENQEEKSFTINQTHHPFELYLLNEIALKATPATLSVSMNASFAYSDQLTFTSVPFSETQRLITWEAPIYLLTKEGVSGIRILDEPWNLDLKFVTLPEAE